MIPFPKLVTEKMLEEDICANLDLFFNALTWHIANPSLPSPACMSSSLNEEDPHVVKYIMRETRASTAFLSVVFIVMQARLSRE